MLHSVYVNSFFPRAVSLWNSLSIEYFPLIYDFSGFKSRINRYLLTVVSFQTDFLYSLTFMSFFSCNSMPHSAYTGCSALHGVNPNLKKKQKKHV